MAPFFQLNYKKPALGSSAITPKREIVDIISILEITAFLCFMKGCMRNGLTNITSIISFELIEENKDDQYKEPQFLKVYKVVASEILWLSSFTI